MPTTSAPTTRPLRGLIALILSVAMTLAVPGTAHARAVDGEYNTIAEAVNTTDGAREFEVAFEVLNVNRGPVRNGNLASAYASCTDCQTVAISVQVLLLQSRAASGEIRPENLAIPVNEECTRCDTGAYAHQLVKGRAGYDAELTPRGERAVARIASEIEALRNRPELTTAEIDAYVNARIVELRRIIDREIRYQRDHD